MILRKRKERRWNRKRNRWLPAVLFSLLLLSASPIQATAVTLSIDNSQTAIPCGLLTDGTVAVPIRAASDAVLYNTDTVSWNGQAASVTTANLSLTARPGDRYITANGRYLGSDAAVFAYQGSIYVPVRTLAKALGCNISWNGSTGTVQLTRGSGTILSGSNFYHADNLFWLSRIISAESKGEPMTGKIAVGNVIQNRMRSSDFPNDYYGVIFDTKFGVQFTPVANGTIHDAPSTDSTIAAKICLDGYSISDSILYFLDPVTSKNPWAASHRPYAFTIGGHDFYR